MKSADQLVADYIARWTKYRVDGRGKLVPRVKFADLDKLATSAAAFQMAVLSADFKPQEKSFAVGEKLWLAGMANAKEVDRMREVLNPTGVQAGAFLKNPVLLAQHDHSKPIGRVTQLRPEDNGVLFEAWAGDPKAGAALTRAQEEYRSLIAQRILQAVSVGFIPHEIRMPSYDANGDMVDPAMIELWEMLELSVVAVPCNAGALFDMKSAPDARAAGDTDRDFLKSLSFPRLGSGGIFVIKPTGTEA